MIKIGSVSVNENFIANAKNLDVVMDKLKGKIEESLIVDLFNTYNSSKSEEHQANKEEVNASSELADLPQENGDNSKSKKKRSTT